MTDESERASYLPANFDHMLNTWLQGTGQLVDAVLAVSAVREPEKYRDAVELVNAGRLFPRVEWHPGALRISLIDAATCETIGDIFQYTAPALAARGRAN